jgi:hypothetical protein
MHETFSLFLGSTSHRPNRHTHSNSREIQSRTSQNQNPKPEKHRRAMEHTENAFLQIYAPS